MRLLERIGWIGLGNMGNPISTNLRKAGFELYVTDVVREKGEPLCALGAVWCENAAEVARKADIIFTSVPNGKIFKSVALDRGGISEGIGTGKLVVDMSTIAPADSLEVCNVIEQLGAKMLRAPVTGSTVLAQSASIGVLVSGERKQYERALPCFKAISNKQFYLGEGECARVLKLAINLMVGMNMQMLAEAMLLADKAGLDWIQTLEVISESAAGAPVIQYKRSPISKRVYPPAFSVKMMEKDFDLALDAAKMYGAALPMSALTRQMFAAATAAGYGEEDFSVLVEVMSSLCSQNKISGGQLREP